MQPATQVVDVTISQTNNINSLASKLAQIGTLIMYLLVALALVYIIWNVVQYVIKGGSPEGKTEALHGVGYGIVGLAIIFSIWGLVNILLGTFNTGNDVPTKGFPTANFVTGTNANGDTGNRISNPVRDTGNRISNP